MITRRAFMMGVGAASLCAWLAKAERDRDKFARAAQNLIDISFWAWGGIGIAQTISGGESAFRTVCQAAPQAAEKAFQTVYAKAKPAGRLYALLGLRDLAPARFEKLLPSSLHSTAILETINGCIVDTDTEESIATLIYAGAWGIKPKSAEEIRKRLLTIPASQELTVPLSVLEGQSMTPRNVKG